jgi:peptide/nickel transport system permease protein
MANAATRVDQASYLGKSYGGARSRRTRLVHLAGQQKLGVVACAILAIMTVMAILAPLIVVGQDPYRMSSAHVLQPPGAGHLMGTDELGRDVFSRVVYGARISLWVGFIAVGISSSVGITLGMVGGYVGTWVDFSIQRVVDAMFAFPTLILALAIVAVLGKGVIQVTVAIGITGIPGFARLARAATLAVVAQPYVEATNTMGATTARVVFRHVLPNILAPMIVLATAGLGFAILAEASLSFLGLGTPAPQPSWGTMLSGGAQQYVRAAPYLAIFPGLAISLAVFGFNMMGDSLRDIFDPRLRGG